MVPVQKTQPLKTYFKLSINENNCKQFVFPVTFWSQSKQLQVIFRYCYAQSTLSCASYLRKTIFNLIRAAQQFSCYIWTLMPKMSRGWTTIIQQGRKHEPPNSRKHYGVEAIKCYKLCGRLNLFSLTSEYNINLKFLFRLSSSKIRF